MGRKHLVPLVGALLSGLAVGAHAASAQSVEFDFQYGISGPAQVQPLQVFDNGTETFFRFKDDTQAVPTILAETARGLVATRNFRSGPFVVVAGVASGYRLTLGPLEATVNYAGGSSAREATPRPKPVSGSPPPETEAAASAGGSGASATLPAAAASAPVVPVGHVASVATAASVAPVAPPTPAVPVWRLERGVALHTQLHQWAMAAGWTLEWKPSRSWIVPADARFEGSFDQAIEKVVQTLTDEGKPVRLVLWEGNHVAEISEVAR